MMVMSMLYIFCLSEVRGNASKSLLMFIVVNNVRCAGFCVLRISCMCFFNVMTGVVIEEWASNSSWADDTGM